jgi:outer membrane protein TolC
VNAHRPLPSASLLALALAGLAPAAFAADAQPAPAAIEQRLTALIARPGGLTSDQAAERARTTSHDVRAKSAEQAAEDSLLDQATLAYVPRIKGTASYTRTSPLTLSLGTLAFVFPEDNYNFQVDVDVPLSDYALKIAKHRASQEHSAKAAQLTERASELTAASNARITYYGWARARLNLVVVEGALENARQHRNDVKAELAAGKASQADVMSVEARVSEIELTVTRAKNAIALADDRLHVAMHDSSGAAYEIGEPLLADLAPLPGEGDVSSLFTEAQGKRPELLSIGETSRGLHMQASSAKMDLLPKIDAVGSAQYANPNPRYFPPANQWNGTWSAGVALTWTATDIVLGGTTGSATESRAKASDEQALALREAVRDDVLRSWQEVKEAIVAIQSTQQSLASAEEAHRVRVALFHADRATSTELNDAEDALTRARFEVVGARIDQRVARVHLLHATGRDGDR